MFGCDYVVCVSVFWLLVYVLLWLVCVFVFSVHRKVSASLYVLMMLGLICLVDSHNTTITNAGFVVNCCFFVVCVLEV